MPLAQRRQRRRLGQRRTDEHRTVRCLPPFAARRGAQRGTTWQLGRAANPRRPGARVSVPTLGLDGAAGPNTFVDFLAPNPMVLSQRVEEPAQASRKRALPASEPPLEQRQVERVNHLGETRLTEQLVTHRRYRPCTTQNEHRPLSLRPPLAQNGASSKTIPRLELPISRIKRIMKEDSCSDPLVRIPACLPVVAPCNPLRGALERPCPQCAGDWTVCTGRVRLRCLPLPPPPPPPPPPSLPPPPPPPLHAIRGFARQLPPTAWIPSCSMRTLHGRPNEAGVAVHGARQTVTPPLPTSSPDPDPDPLVTRVTPVTRTHLRNQPSLPPAHPAQPCPPCPTLPTLPNPAHPAHPCPPCPPTLPTLPTQLCPPCPPTRPPPSPLHPLQPPPCSPKSTPPPTHTPQHPSPQPQPPPQPRLHPQPQPQPRPRPRPRPQPQPQPQPCPHATPPIACALHFLTARWWCLQANAPAPGRHACPKFREDVLLLARHHLACDGSRE